MTEQLTQEAFRNLWQIWQDNQGIGDDNNAWDCLMDAVRETVVQSSEAADPEFITDFAEAVLNSLDRMNGK